MGWSYIIFYAPRTTYILIVTSGSRTRGQIPCSVIRINRISGKSSCRLVAPGGPIIMILSSSLFRRHWEWPRGCITLFIGWLDGRMGGSVLLGTACYLSLRDSRAAGIGEFQQTETMPYLATRPVQCVASIWVRIEGRKRSGPLLLLLLLLWHACVHTTISSSVGTVSQPASQPPRLHCTRRAILQSE